MWGALKAAVVSADLDDIPGKILLILRTPVSHSSPPPLVFVILPF